MPDDVPDPAAYAADIDAARDRMIGFVWRRSRPGTPTFTAPRSKPPSRPPVPNKRVIEQGRAILPLFPMLES